MCCREGYCQAVNVDLSVVLAVAAGWPLLLPDGKRGREGLQLQALPLDYSTPAKGSIIEGLKVRVV